MVDHELLDYRKDTVHGIVIESKCTYLKEFPYPDVAQAGLKLQSLRSMSVVYDIGLFHVGDDNAAALGYLVHVYVDTESRQPVRVPAAVRAGVEVLA